AVMQKPAGTAKPAWISPPKFVSSQPFLQRAEVLFGQASPGRQRVCRNQDCCSGSTEMLGSSYVFLLPFHPWSPGWRSHVRDKAGDGEHDERYPDHSRKHPERERRELLQARDQVGVIHVKGRPQDNI